MADDLVTSPHNARLKLVRKLAGRRGRERERAFAVEGEDLVAAALAGGIACRFLLHEDAPPDASAALPIPGAGSDAGFVDPAVDVSRVSRELLAAISTLGHPPRAIGVFDLPDPVHRLGKLQAALDASPTGPVVYLAGLSDPGNVGTILRSAAALGAVGVAMGPGTADPFSPKALRAAMGATFAVPHAPVPDARWSGRPLAALSGTGDDALWDTTLTDGVVLCIGDERSGLPADVVADAAMVVRIPQSDAVESLNAGQAATLALYEWQRQRRTREHAGP